MIIDFCLLLRWTWGWYRMAKRKWKRKRREKLWEKKSLGKTDNENCMENNNMIMIRNEDGKIIMIINGNWLIRIILLVDLLFWAISLMLFDFTFSSFLLLPGLKMVAVLAVIKAQNGFNWLTIQWMICSQLTERCEIVKSFVSSFTFLFSLFDINQVFTLLIEM